MLRHTISAVVIQATPFCNIDCDYCYLENRIDRRVMSLNTFESIARTIFASRSIGSDLTFVWHSGEPLAVGRDFYLQALDLVNDLAPPSCKIRFSFQTNGLLLNDAWCEFFKETGAKIGVSIDGPAWMHDAQRKTRKGTGTHAAAIRGVELLRKNGIPFGVISVITNQTLTAPNDLYAFIKSLRSRSWAFNVEALDFGNSRRSFSDPQTDDQLRPFIRELFRIWLNDPERIRVREFDSALQAIAQKQVGRKNDATPLAILNVGVDGRFSTFSPELFGHTTHHGEFIFGNATALGVIEDFQSDERFLRISQEIDRGIAQCQYSCEYFQLCGGGTPASRFFETGAFDVSRTRYCMTNRIILIDEVLAVLEEGAEWANCRRVS